MTLSFLGGSAKEYANSMLISVILSCSPDDSLGRGLRVQERRAALKGVLILGKGEDLGGSLTADRFEIKDGRLAGEESGVLEMDGDVELEVVLDVRVERAMDLDREWNDAGGGLT